MGAGKSTVGPRLAARLGLPFLDLDAHLADTHACSPAALFAARGEAAFRELETAAIREIIARPAPAVLSLGGGALHTPGNLALLREAFDVVVLHAALETVRARLSSDPDAVAARPLWPELAARYAARLPGYRAAGPGIPTDHRTPEQVVDAIVAVLEEGDA